MHATKRNLLVAEIQMISEQIKSVEQELEQYSKENVEVWQLRSIPGVGMRTAEAVVPGNVRLPVDAGPGRATTAVIRYNRGRWHHSRKPPP